ncbi:hypothetical protein SAMN02746065_102279 [Desulfocicer vacuolatum DSM 3385]|uniref:DUF4124 domain-containing protein n=1 Tax=Desulfocicer vacuolatum DSM 3385 TaxID=1121400 RepID=A0A1W1ZH13_9BACT|nr:hypothetical protein [Desulfocicer vacuolatum]SMC47472.1 hypothetical protein SAMN02746065_102279 [Desulfocicer vacuolatum DSM 3385]
MKLIKYGMLICFIFLLTMDLPVSAQLYQYRDENGILSFTDDFSKLPVAQRDQMKVINEMKTEPVENSQTEEVAHPPIPDKNNALSDVLMKKADALMQENIKLKEDYAVIIEENKQLAILRQKLEARKKISRSEWDDFNKRVSDINIKIQQYESRLHAHKDQSAAYNMKLEQLKKFAEMNNGD